jgi:hypothetical protein
MCDAGRARQAKAKAVLGRNGRFGGPGTTMAMAEAAGAAATASTLLGTGGVYSDMGVLGGRMTVQLAGTGGSMSMPERGVRKQAINREAGNTSSRFLGVTWDKGRSAWKVRMTDPLTHHRQFIGSYASEEAAARAYDCAAVQAHGPGVKRNFPSAAEHVERIDLAGSESE